jgi:hypothetical protein
MTQPISSKKPSRDYFDRGTAPDSRHHGTAADRADVLNRFDTGNLQLLEDAAEAQGFDPYRKGRMRSSSAAKTTTGRTDLRALSAQILAERERKQVGGQ